jgi:hypothetical protein
MKNAILLLLTVFALASCKKEAQINPKITAPAKTSVISSVNQDSIPDNAALKIQLAKDSVNTDETMFLFKKSAPLTYDDNNDADYFAGYGAVSLSSITPDGKDLSIYNLPYTSGMAIGLNVHTQDDGTYYLKVSYKSKIPSNIQVWIKDTYLKDSVNVSTGSYKFAVIKADAGTFGSKRFKLVIK